MRKPIAFRLLVESLEPGELVIFTFHSRVKWAWLFIALFNVKPHMFEICDQISEVPTKTVNWLALTSFESLSHMSVTCKVLTRLADAQVDLNWMVQYLLPTMSSFIVLKPE